MVSGPLTNMAAGKYGHRKFIPCHAIYGCRYLIASETTGGIWSKPYIWIPLIVKMCLPENDSGSATNMAE